MSEFNRRDFVAAGGAALAGLGLAGTAGAHNHTSESQPAAKDMMSELLPGAVNQLGTYTLPKLGYEYNALEPSIDAQTMEIHHSKHHAGYVKGLNAANLELKKMNESGDYSLINHWSEKSAFTGGGHFLHTMFWASMSPDGGGNPTGKLAMQLSKDFGSVDAFKAHFSAASKGVQGSGWGLMAVQIPSKRLVVVQAQNQHLNTQWAMIPLLGIDVWEHAYYLKYQNNRGAYVDNWWKVVDWKAVGERYEKILNMIG